MDNKFSISSSSIVPNSSLILIIIDKPKALVATPTTIAVRIKTWGSGLEYVENESANMGGVPPIIFPGEM